MITHKQKAILHIAKAQLGLDREHYESILRQQAGVLSSTELTNKQFDKVMTRLEELGFTNTARRPKTRRAPADPITPEQLQRIADLYAQLGWDELARRAGFSRRQCGKSWPQTRVDGIKVIEGLKAMVKREERKE